MTFLSFHWHCLKTQPKHEHIAAAALRRLDQVEVYSPRMRFRKATRRGPVWFVESLFPGYLFARFDLSSQLQLIRHCNGVSEVVHFGPRWPVLSDDTIQQLRARMGENEIRTMSALPGEGETVQICGGVFSGLEAVVTGVLPTSQRVRVLLEFLGRQTPLELPGENVTPKLSASRQLIGV